MKQITIIILLMIGVQTLNAQSTKDEKMDTFISNLLNQMTIQEKIGQLNLVTPGGGILTGSVVSIGVGEKMKAGNVGGIFGIYGPSKVRRAQELAVKESRLGIPLLFGSDVIHGYKTTFPIPLGLSCSWDMALIEKTARIAAT